MEAEIICIPGIDFEIEVDSDENIEVEFSTSIVNPSGSTTITENGTWDVERFASAIVDVPQPSGYTTITENGTWDVTDFQDAIVNVRSGQSSDWERPSDWPQYNEDLVDDFEVCYITYDTEVTPYGFMAVRYKTGTSNAGIVVTPGTIINGSFVSGYGSPKSSSIFNTSIIFTFDSDLDPDAPRYICFKIEPRVYGTHILYLYFYQSQNVPSFSGAIGATLQPAVEIYGRLPWLDGSAISPMATVLTKSITLYDIGKENQLTTLKNIFSGGRSLKVVKGLETWDTSEVTSMEGMFNICQHIKKLDLSSFSFAKCTTMMKMFYACSSLDEVNLGASSTPVLASMMQMFSQCNSLRSVYLGNFTTENVTNMSYLFDQCHVLDLSKVGMENFDTVSVTTMERMFNSASCYCDLLDLSNFDTSSVENFRQMFSSCGALTIDISSFDFSFAETLYYMFRYSTSENIKFPKNNLISKTIHGVTKSWYSSNDCGSVTDISYLFGGMTSMMRVDGFLALTDSFSISDFYILDLSDFTDIFNELPVVSGKTITIRAKSKQNLTAAQLAIATSKGWTVA